MVFMDFIREGQVQLTPRRSCTGYCRILRNSPHHTAQTEGYLLTQIAKEYALIESRLRTIDWIEAQQPYEIQNPKCPGCVEYSPAEKARLIAIERAEIAAAEKRIGDLTLTLNKLREQYQGSAIAELGAANLIPDEEFQKGLIHGGLRKELREKLEKLFPQFMPAAKKEKPVEEKVLGDVLPSNGKGNGMGENEQSTESEIEDQEMGGNGMDTQLKDFWEKNKDWLIPVGGSVLVAFLAPSILGRRGIGKIVQIAALGYGGYVVYKNWDKIKANFGK